MSPHRTTTQSPGALRRLGWGVVLAFTLKGMVTTGLIVFATFKAAGIL